MPLNPARNLSEQLAEHISERIIRGELAPGDRLPEAELARQLDVSTNSLREAFRLVEKRHLVEIQPRRGVRVKPVDETQVRELYDFLFVLLGQLASRAASGWKPGEIEDLVALVGRMAENVAAGDVAAFHDTAFEFIHNGLRFAANAYLVDAIEDLLPQLQRFSYIALIEETTELEVSLAIFQRLVQHVVQRQAEQATADIREYGANQCQIVLRALAKRHAA
ncbi:MAG: GntR family transcriptional regulator [Alcanivoracaceae bacterium]